MHTTFDTSSGKTFAVITTNACVSCSQTGVVTVPKAEWDAWQRGAHIQTAMPSMSADDRERLLTGTCGPCFDDMFAEEDYNPDEDGYYCSSQDIIVGSPGEDGMCPECGGELV